MKKKLTLLVLVILITLVTATTALASHEKQSFTIGGCITDIVDNTVYNTIPSTITVQKVNDRFETVQVTVQVTDDTSFFRRISDGVFDEIDFTDLAEKDSTNIKYTVDDGVNVASQVKVDVELHCNP